MKKAIITLAMIIISSSAMADNLSSSTWGDSISNWQGDTISTMGTYQEYNNSTYGTYDYVSGVEVPTIDPLRPSSWGCTALGQDLGNC